MEQEIYSQLKTDLEIYFAACIRNRFKTYVQEHGDLHFAADYSSRCLIDELLRGDGLDVYGMNINADEFRVILHFKHEYSRIDSLPFSGMLVDFNNKGDYSVYLGDDSFDDEWTVELVDEHNRRRSLNENDFIKALKDIKQAHLLLTLKKKF
jgi:hypothetical protein